MRSWWELGSTQDFYGIIDEIVFLREIRDFVRADPRMKVTMEELSRQ
jgi:hypothetical protein